MPTPTNFAVPVNNASTTLSVAKTTTTLPQTITLTNGAVLPALTGSQKYRVTICQVAFAYSPTATTSNYTVYMADTVSGNNITLESLSTTEGQTQTDRTYAIGDIVEVRVTAGTLKDIHAAVNALETAGSGVTIGAAVSGGTNNRALYVDGSGNLADSGLVFDGLNFYNNTSGCGIYSTGFGPGKGQTFQFDGANLWQNYYGSGLETYSYWGQYISGNRQAAAPATNLGGASSDPSLTVIGTQTGNTVLAVQAASGQTGDIEQWRNSTSTALSGVGPAGHIRTVVGAGAPGGTPPTGSMYYDSTNNFLYIYNGGWKKSTVYA